ncbi:MAG: prepilin-type N-terminal cleavage/methylation domain-containing protein [Acidimicrobiales bacterium]
MNELLKRHRHNRNRITQSGFTLIELLVVIIILGILAAVVVFAVGGVGDKGQASALRIDSRTLVTALEANCANDGEYVDEAGLVANGLLSEQSTTHDVFLNSAGLCGTGLGSGYVITCTADAAVCESEGITVNDSAGKSVTLLKPATKVACLTGACVDAMVALGAADKMVIRALDSSNVAPAVAHYNTLSAPFDISTIPLSLGDFFTPDIAQIAASGADLVIGLGPFHGASRPAIESLGIAFLDMDLANFQLAISNVYKVGKLLGLNADAETANNLLRDQIAAYAALSPKTRVPVNIYNFGCCGIEILLDSTESQGGSLWLTQGSYPWPSYTGSSYLSGGQNTYDIAQLKAVDPDAIFVIRSQTNTTTVNDPGNIRSYNPVVWDSLKAVIDGRVYEGPDVKSWPWSAGGTISAKETLDRGMDLLYPEVAAFPLP